MNPLTFSVLELLRRGPTKDLEFVANFIPDYEARMDELIKFYGCEIDRRGSTFHLTYEPDDIDTGLSGGSPDRAEGPNQLHPAATSPPPAAESSAVLFEPAPYRVAGWEDWE